MAKGENTADHPKRKVERGTYGQELDAWSAADSREKLARETRGDYEGYMASIGQRPKSAWRGPGTNKT